MRVALIYLPPCLVPHAWGVLAIGRPRSARVKGQPHTVWSPQAAGGNNSLAKYLCGSQRCGNASSPALTFLSLVTETTSIPTSASTFCSPA